MAEPRADPSGGEWPTPLTMVREFHVAFGLPFRDHPEMPDEVERTQRADLLNEEVAELPHVRCVARDSGRWLHAVADDLVGR
jgi:predicted HAD superfamily Cof-like phosphohydrolase